MNALDPTGRYRGRSNTDNLGGSQVLQGIPDESEDPKCKAQETWAVLKEKTVIPIAAAGHSPAVMARTKAPTVRQLSSWRPAGNVPNAAKSGAWAIWSNVPVSSASNIQHPTSNIQHPKSSGVRPSGHMEDGLDGIMGPRDRSDPIRTGFEPSFPFGLQRIDDQRLAAARPTRPTTAFQACCVFGTSVPNRIIRPLRTIRA